MLIAYQHTSVVSVVYTVTMETIEKFLLKSPVRMRKNKKNFDREFPFNISVSKISTTLTLNHSKLSLNDMSLKNAHLKKTKK